MSRREPMMPVGNYQSYLLRAPIETHWRAATCAEVACPNYLNGWRIRIEGLAPQDLHLATSTGRKWQQVNVADGENWLVFEAGQPCFAGHRTRLEKPEIFVQRDGDSRGNPTGVRRVHTAATWVDSFANHQDKIADIVRRG